MEKKLEAVERRDLNKDYLIITVKAELRQHKFATQGLLDTRPDICHSRQRKYTGINATENVCNENESIYGKRNTTRGLCGHQKRNIN